MTLSTRPLGGMRQRLPGEFRRERFVTETLRGVSLTAGFDEYDGPVIEPLELFAAKSGGELVKRQSYTFHDRGNREVVLRPEMTPSLARMIASQGELQLPVRWFSIPLCYRYERPQRGRVREFLQYNCDIMGAGSIAAELEMFLVLQGIMEAFNVPADVYRISWSSRRFMSEALERCGVESTDFANVFSAIDKRDKMKPEHWMDFLVDSCSGDSETAGRVATLVDVESFEDPWLTKLVSDSQAFREIREFDRLIRQVGITSAVFSPGVVRGLDYYTGIVFELMDTGGENRRALCGGGRYDNLVGLFGKKRISGVGFGLGVLTLTLFLETYGLIPDEVETASPADVFVVVPAPALLAQAAQMAHSLRLAGVRVMLDVTGKKPARQYAEAKRLNIPVVITVGEGGKHKISEAGSQLRLTYEQILDRLKRQK